MAQRRNTRSRPTHPENATLDIGQLVSQQLMATIPNIMAEVTAGVNASQKNCGGPTPVENTDGSGDRNVETRGCTYKYFISYKTKEFHGQRVQWDY